MQPNDLWLFRHNAATFYAVRDSGTLLSIDTTTFNVATVGSMGITTAFGDLAYDALTQSLTRSADAIMKAYTQSIPRLGVLVQREMESGRSLLASI